MDKWPLKQTKKIYKSKHFDIIAERIESKELNPKFNSKILRFKIKLDLKTHLNDGLLLNDLNIDILKEALENIFIQLKNNFKKRDGPYYIQMNLAFNGLKKKFIKSGIVDLFGNIESHNIVYWVLNQLDQVAQSSDNLIFSNGFFIDFIIVKTIKPRGRHQYFSNKFIISKYAKDTARLVSNMKKNYFFLNEIFKGYVDMSLYFENNVFEDNFTCILISIYFGIIFQENNNDMKRTLTYINSRFINLEQFQKSFITRFGLNMTEYYNDKTNIKLYQYISEKIKRNISLFVKSSDDTCRVIYTTELVNCAYIKIIIENSHCKFIFNNNNLEKKKKTFCDYCQKSFYKIKQHKCKRKKCLNCFLYKNRLLTDSFETVCDIDRIKNIDYRCNNCFKTITNDECKKRHVLLNIKNCKSTLFCDICQRVYYNNNILHKCDEFFCKKCLNQHQKSLFCSTSIKEKKKKVNENPFILNLKVLNDNYKVLSLAFFSPEKHIYLYLFYSNENYYKRIKFDIETMNHIENEIFNIKIDLSITQIIEELDIVNLKPKLLMNINTFNYFVSKEDLNNCEISSKDSSIYYVKSKFYSLFLINEYILYDKVYILKYLNIPICPLYILDIEYFDSNIELEDFTRVYKHSQIEMYDYLNSFDYEMIKIKQLDIIEFMEKSCFFETVVYIKSLISINTLINELNSQMNLYYQNQNNNFKCITQRKSFSSFVFDLFLNALKNDKLPVLSSQTPGNINNTSKFEIAFCEELTLNHSSKFKNHNIMSYINNNGIQFQHNKYSLDW